MQILGICRFSYPALGGFQIEHDSIEERCDYLYAPEQLDMRFSCFETLTLHLYALKMIPILHLRFSLARAFLAVPKIGCTR